MFGIEKDFQNLMEQVYGPLNKDKMTETDISKVLIEGEYATIMGVKYKRVEEPKSPVAEAYKEWWGQYPELETDSEYDDMRWQGFQAGYEVGQPKAVSVEEPTKPRSPLDEIVDKLVKEQQAQKLYNRLYDEQIGRAHV